MEQQFINYCNESHLTKAQELLKSNTKINISADNECAFRWACFYGDLEVALWLYSIKPTIDVSADDEFAFRWACGNGYLDVSQWLYSIKPTIDVGAHIEHAFLWACNSGNLDIVQWLCELRPEKYSIVIEKDRLISWKVTNNLKKEKETKQVEQIETCAICQENQSGIITECNHQYCYECLSNWYSNHNNCPYCTEDEKPLVSVFGADDTEGFALPHVCRQKIDCCFSIVLSDNC